MKMDLEIKFEINFLKLEFTGNTAGKVALSLQSLHAISCGNYLNLLPPTY